MPFWNPKQYNPLAQQYGMSMLQQQMGAPPAMSPWQGLANALKMGLAGFMVGGQRKAEERARAETRAGLKEALSMQPATRESLVTMPNLSMGVPGMSNLQELPVTTLTEPAETRQQFQQRRLDTIAETLLSSEIPEYRAQGESLLIQSMQAKTPQLQFMKSGDDIVGLHPVTGESFIAHQGKEKLDPQQFDPEQPVWGVSDDGEIVLLQEATKPPGVDAPKSRKSIGPDGKTYWEDWNAETGKWEMTTSETGEAGQRISVYTGEGPPTQKTMGDVYSGWMKAEKSLGQLYNLRDTFQEEAFTWTDKGKQKYEGVRASMPMLKELLPELKPGKEVAKTAYFMANVANFANNMIRDITGAQMTVQEVPRLLLGIFNQYDDPISARAKLQFTIDHMERLRDFYRGEIDKAKRIGMTDEEAKEAAERSTAEEVRRLQTRVDTINEYGVWEQTLEPYQQSAAEQVAGGTGVPEGWEEEQ